MNLHTRPEDARVLSEVKATGSGAFLCMETDRAAARITGKDTLDLLNRLTTMKVDTLEPGQVRETLLTNEKGRVIDAALVLVREEDVLLLLSPGKAAEVITWLEKYTIMEDCVYEDISASVGQCSVYQVTADLRLGSAAVPEAGRSAVVTMGETTVRVAHHRSVTGAGLRLLFTAEDTAAVRDFLTGAAGLPVVGAEAATLWRIDRLLPSAGHELSLLANPLEAGAAEAVDFEKGCYIGQEVIARLDSYDKVQRRPCRIRWDSGKDPAAEPGSTLFAGGKNAGFLTTAAFDPRIGAYRGIALLRHAYAAPGTPLFFDAEGGQPDMFVEK